MANIFDRIRHYIDKRKKKLPVWVWILIALAIFASCTTILVVVIFFIAKSQESDNNSQYSVVDTQIGIIQDNAMGKLCGELRDTIVKGLKPTDEWTAKHPKSLEITKKRALDTCLRIKDESGDLSNCSSDPQIQEACKSIGVVIQ